MSFLEFYRAVLARKCVGLTAHQLDTATSASTLTLGRLLRHMALVEDHWFQSILHDRELPDVWHTIDWDAHPDGEMDTAADFAPTELAQQFDEAVARSRVAVEGIGLDEHAAREGPLGPTNLRWIMVHMIEEYARHCGHADFLRESIDGTVGD